MRTNTGGSTLRSVPVSCNRDCGGGCPLIAEVENGRLIAVRDNPRGTPYMSGCNRGYQMPKVVYAPDRIKRPLLRTGSRGSGAFEEVSWSKALDHVADRLSEIRDRHGAKSVIHLGSSGACRGAMHNTAVLTSRFLRLFGGCTLTLSNYSAAAAYFASPYVLGTPHTGLDAATLQHSKLIILWGANIRDIRFGCETEKRIREQKERGIPVIVIDPRRTGTAKQLGTEWLSVYPGTDTALMAAVFHVLISEDLLDRGFIERYSVGFEELEDYILDGPKSPEWAEGVCGTPAEKIRDLARLYGRSKPAALLPGLSIQRTVGGEEAVRMAAALQVATGNVGIPGGSTGGKFWGGLPGPKCGTFPPLKAGAAGPDEMPGVPVYRWPDAVLEGTTGGFPTDVKAIYNVAANYLCQGSDVRKSIKAFESVEFSVCHDLFLTPTARYCDVVLPVTTWLEREDIVFPGINYLFYSAEAVEPLHEARNDYDIFCELAERMDFLQEYSGGRTADRWIEEFITASDIPDTEEFRTTGMFRGPEQMRIGLSDFVRDPAAHPLPTDSGKIEISSQSYAKTGFPAYPTCRVMETNERFPLRLITPHARYRVNSQLSNIPWFAQREEPALWIHPEDARTRSIAAGMPVLVESPRGQVNVKARVTEDIMPGVVCLPTGAWFEFGPDGKDTAGCANVLTSTEPTLPSQGSRTHSVLVEVTPSLNR